MTTITVVMSSRQTMPITAVSTATNGMCVTTTIVILSRQDTSTRPLWLVCVLQRPRHPSSPRWLVWVPRRPSRSLQRRTWLALEWSEVQPRPPWVTWSLLARDAGLSGVNRCYVGFWRLWHTFGSKSFRCADMLFFIDPMSLSDLASQPSVDTVLSKGNGEERAIFHGT